MATRTTSPNRGTRKKQKKRNPFFSFLKFLYIVIVILSIIIVGLFIAYKAFIRPPDVEDQVTFPVTSPEPDDTAQPSAGRASTRMPASLRPSTSTSFGHLTRASPPATSATARPPRSGNSGS